MSCSRNRASSVDYVKSFEVTYEAINRSRHTLLNLSLASFIEFHKLLYGNLTISLSPLLLLLRPEAPARDLVDEVRRYDINALSAKLLFGSALFIMLSARAFMFTALFVFMIPLFALLVLLIPLLLVLSIALLADDFSRLADNGEEKDDEDAGDGTRCVCEADIDSLIPPSLSLCPVHTLLLLLLLLL